MLDGCAVLYLALLFCLFCFFLPRFYVPCTQPKAFSTKAGFDKKQSQAVMQFAAFVKAEFEEAGPQVTLQ